MPSPALKGRDPQQGKKGFSTNKGFTVIELMISIAVLAIITSLALPSYRAIIEKRQVTSGAEQLTAFLSAAQMEAVKRNQPVAIACTKGSGRCEALLLADEDDKADESLRVLEFADLKADVVDVVYGRTGAERVTFDPVRGMLIQADIVTSPIEILLSSRQARTP